MPPSPPPPLEALYRISSLVGKVTEPREALAIVLEEMLTATGAASGSIALIDPTDHSLRVEVQKGLPEDCRDTPLKVGEGITGWAALHGKPVLAPDVLRDSRYRKLSDAVRGEMAAPILDGDQALGVVSMNSHAVNRFDQAALDLLVSLTAETASLLRQLWLVNQLKTKAGHLEAVLAVGQGIVSRLDQREILRSITRQTVPLSGCRLCAIHLLDPTGDALIPLSTAGESAVSAHPDLPVAETSAGVALHRRRQLEIAEIRKVEGWLPLLQFAHAENLVSLLCTPIVFEGEALGILSAYTDRPHRFTNDERNLFQAMASLGAVAIHNARLYERVFQSEETLRQSEKLTALGLLAAEVAHEIRNPLTVLKLLFQSLDLQFPPEDVRQKDVAIIGEKLDQLEATVGRVLSFARPSEEPHALCALDDVVDGTLQLLRLKFQQAGIRVTHWHAPDTPPISGNKGQLQQALLNLLLNSFQAVQAEGVITVRTQAALQDGKIGAAIEIADNGSGIPTELQPEIFKSPLTSHPGGSGLGLGIVKRIIEGHRGQIRLARSGPEGTVMKMWLPGGE